MEYTCLTYRDIQVRVPPVAGMWDWKFGRERRAGGQVGRFCAKGAEPEKSATHEGHGGQDRRVPERELIRGHGKEKEGRPRMWNVTWEDSSLRKEPALNAQSPRRPGL